MSNNGDHMTSNNDKGSNRPPEMESSTETAAGLSGRTKWLIGIGSALVVLAVIGAVVGVTVSQSSFDSSKAAESYPTSPTTISPTVTSPPSTLDSSIGSPQKEVELLDWLGTMLFFMFGWGSVVNPNPYLTQQDRDLHNSLDFVADMHADTANLMPYSTNAFSKVLGQKVSGSEERTANEDSHVDAVRLVQGNIALQVFAMYSEGSADTLSASEFTTKVMDENGTMTSPQTFIFRNWQRNPSSQFFTGPDDFPSYESTYKWIGLPRSPVQYLFALGLGYPCEFWFDKKTGEEWPGSPDVGDWPMWVESDFLDRVNGEQRCFASDADPEADYHTAIALKFADDLHAAANFSNDG